jgi:PAS domain S-box-containing protein
MNQPPRNPDQARAELYEIMQADLSFQEKVNRALELGEDYFGVDNGHLVRIDEPTDHWRAIASTDPPDGQFPPDLVLDYPTTYCRVAVERGESVALHDAPNQGWADEPAFESHGLHCYHGTPITVDGDLFGTVCFVAERPREEPFTDSETLFAELVARMLEHELRRTRQQSELDRTAGLITVLSRVLRHNIRNDLNVVRGHLSLLVDRSADAHNLYEITKQKLSRLITLAETARELESIAVSDLEHQPVDLTGLVEEVSEELQPVYPDASFTVDGPRDVIVEAMPTLRRALFELIENAAKHGGERPAVTVALEETQSRVEVEIRDTGPGLPEQEREVLDHGTEQPLVHGSGLGLWLTYWIVSEHDGTIDPTVSSEGTRVTVTLPRTEIPTDLSDRADLVRLFRREQDRFEAVFQKSCDGILILDDEGRCIEANLRAAELLGLPEDDLLGRSFEPFTPDRIDFEDLWRALEQNGESRARAPLVRPDGTEWVVEYSATADIVPGEHLVIFRDVTDREDEGVPNSGGVLESCVVYGPD